MPGAVTTIVKNRPILGKELECLEWMKKTSTLASRFDGFVEKEMFQSVTEERILITIFTFDTEKNLKKWEESETKKKQIELGKDYVDSFIEKQHFTGLELFSPDQNTTLGSPRKWKMFCIVVVVLFLLFNSAVPAIGIIFDEINLPLQLEMFLRITVVSALMTFIVMPLVTKLLHSWLAR